ncbi:hypothetical protein GCM10010466_08360 [Planomonospora alba]|uniref:Uncharacterized protein n=1 Tax=Planomonospora alba TaxID=161354 RepID=A0ABP6MNZ2_9ACTN
MLPQVGRHGGLDVRKMRGGHIAQARVQVYDVVTCQAVEHAGALPAGGDESSLLQGLEVSRGARHTETRGLRQDLDTPFPLCEQVEELQALAVTESFTDPGDLVKEGGFPTWISHHIILQGAMD